VEPSTSQPLLIPVDVYDAMVSYCVSSPDRPCCGYLGGIPPRATRVYPLRNIATDRRRYEADPSDQIDAVVDMGRRGLSIVAIYHSHVGHPPIPSAADILGHRYGDTPRVIVSVGQETTVRTWRIADGAYAELLWHPLPVEKGPASGDVKDRVVPLGVAGRDGAPRPVSSLGKTLSRLIRWLGPSVGAPGDGPRDRSIPCADPMWDPILDQPRDRAS
jgi:proteasome lid subunit RPN8/RPN11